VYPSPVSPAIQVHAKLHAMVVQSANGPHPPLSVAHSTTSSVDASTANNDYYICINLILIAPKPMGCHVLHLGGSKSEGHRNEVGLY